MLRPKIDAFRFCKASETFRYQGFLGFLNSFKFVFFHFADLDREVIFSLLEKQVPHFWIEFLFVYDLL